MLDKVVRPFFYGRWRVTPPGFFERPLGSTRRFPELTNALFMANAFVPELASANPPSSSCTIVGIFLQETKGPGSLV